MSQQKKPIRRWYERNPVLKEAMFTWHRFPRSLQRVLGHQIKKMISQQHVTVRVHGVIDAFYIPLAKIKMIYKSRQKRRWFDFDPVVRSAVHSMYFVEHGDQLRMAERIIYLRSYLDRQELNYDSTSPKDFEKYVDYVFSKKFLAQKRRLF